MQRIRRRAWGAVAAAVLLGLALRLLFGPLPQDPAYHRFADDRSFLGVPHAGDVLTSLAILAAAAFGAAVRPRMALGPCESAAANLLVAGTALAALGSALYHWAPANATLVFDRAAMMLAAMPALVLVAADRLDPRFARDALWPATGFGAGAALFWGLSEAAGDGDLWLYALARIAAPVALVPLLVLRASRHGATSWIWAAVLLQGALAAFERFDHEIYRASAGIASGHNLKHVAGALSLACVFAWLRLRRPRAPAAARAAHREPTSRRGGGAFV